MNPQTITLLIGFATEFGIPAALKIIELFKKKDATVEDVAAAFSLAHLTYESYENLPPDSAVTPLPPA